MIKVVLIIFLLLVIGASIITVPTLKSTIGCYDNTYENFDTLEIQSRGQGWSEEKRCQLRFAQLEETENCISEIKNNYSLPISFETLTTSILSFVRPNIKTVDKLIEEHDNTCQKYPRTMFDPYRFRD